MAVNAHLYFGNYIDDRRQEFNALVDWIMSRFRTQSHAYYPNFMLLGDLNLDYDNPARDRERIEERIIGHRGARRRVQLEIDEASTTRPCEPSSKSTASKSHRPCVPEFLVSIG